MTHPEDFPSAPEENLSGAGGDDSLNLGFGTTSGRRSEMFGGGDEDEEWNEDELGEEPEETSELDEEEEI